jgi:hypothetical protein
VDRNERTGIVQRFRSIEEMNAAPVRARPTDGFERFIRHCARYRSVAPRAHPRGVFKFRSLEEAQRARLSSHTASTRSSQGDTCV